MTTTQEALLTELEPVVEANLNRHLENAKPWNPHDYVPWSRGRDFALLGGQDWTPADSQLDEVSKAAMMVNLLTEDNLPSYHREIAVMAPGDSGSASGQPKRGATPSRSATISSSPAASTP